MSPLVCVCLTCLDAHSFQYYSLFAMTFLLFHWPHDKCPYSTTFRNLGWDPKDGESHLDAMLRPVLLDALVKLGHDKTIHEGARRFRIFVHGHNTSLLPSDTRKVAYLAVMQNVTSSNRSGYDDLLKVYRQTVEAEEKARVLGALCSCKDNNIVLESLNFLFSGEVDILFLFLHGFLWKFN